MIFALLMAVTTLAITWIMAKAPSLASPGTPLGVRVPKAYLSDSAVTSALAGYKVRTWGFGIAATILSLFAWKLPLLAAVPSLLVTLGGLWSYISQRRRIIAAKKAGGWFDEVETTGPGPRKVDTSGVSYAAWVSVAELSASKSSGARRLHQECRLRVL